MTSHNGTWITPKKHLEKSLSCDSDVPDMRDWGQAMMLGERLFTDKHISGVFVPRVSLDPGENQTIALAVSARARGVVPKPPSLWRPKTGVSGLEEIGVVFVRDQFAQSKAPLRMNGGIIFDTPEIGMYPAFFDDEKLLESAKDYLGDDYEFLPDFLLTLPTPVSSGSDGELTTRRPTSRRWPDVTGVAEAHVRGLKGQGVLVGILDTGIDASHAEFKGKRIPFTYVSANPKRVGMRQVMGFDTHGHGTHVAGILSGKTGIAPSSELYVAAVIESETLATSFTRVVYGLNFLLREFASTHFRNRPAIVSLSLGFPPVPPPGMSKPVFDEAKSRLQRAIKELIQANILVISAIGNDGEGLYRLPAIDQEVLAVGAVDWGLSVADFSGGTDAPTARLVPSKPDIVGYGVSVASAWERNIDNRSLFTTMSGTSMATPYVAGIAALYWSRNPRLNAGDLLDMIRANALACDGQPGHRVGAGLARFRV